MILLYLKYSFIHSILLMFSGKFVWVGWRVYRGVWSANWWYFHTYPHSLHTVTIYTHLCTFFKGCTGVSPIDGTFIHTLTVTHLFAHTHTRAGTHTYISHICIAAVTYSFLTRPSPLTAYVCMLNETEENDQVIMPLPTHRPHTTKLSAPLNSLPFSIVSPSHPLPHLSLSEI